MAKNLLFLLLKGHIEEKKSQLKAFTLPLDNRVYFDGENYNTYQQMEVRRAIVSRILNSKTHFIEIQRSKIRRCCKYRSAFSQ